MATALSLLDRGVILTRNFLILGIDLCDWLIYLKSKTVSEMAYQHTIPFWLLQKRLDQYQHKHCDLSNDLQKAGLNISF